MKNKSFHIILWVVANTLIIVSTYAQQVPLNNQYITNRFWLSPAYAGLDGKCNVFTDIRKEWVGVNMAPVSRSLTTNGRLGKNSGLGASIISTEAGIFHNLSAMLSYSYHVKLSQNNFIGIGLGGGVQQSYLDLFQNEPIDDPVLNSVNRSSTYAIASAGIIFKGKNLQFGVSFPQLLSNESNSSRSYTQYQHSMAFAGYTIHLGENWALDPMFVVVKPQTIRYYKELILPIIYKNKFWINVLVKQSSNGAGFGFILKSNIVVNYTFEVYEHGLAHRSTGTHEITLGWKFSDKKTTLKADKKKPYYKWINN
jgi:type IX secretion system PorP/SprF family membrane protein